MYLLAFIVFAAKYFHLLVILVALVILATSPKPTRKDLARLGALTFPLSFLISKIVGHFIYNPRPFVVENIRPLIAHAPNNGFPSNHALLTFTIAFVFFAYNRKIGISLFLLGLIVGAARVAAKIHYPQDILGSIIIAGLATFIGFSTLRIAKRL